MKNNEIKFIGENLYKFRKEKGISQEELADIIGVSRQAVYKWETGERIPDIANLNSLCKEFNKNLDDFVEGAENLLNNMNENLQEEMNLKETNIKESNSENRSNKKFFLKVLKRVIFILLVIYIASVVTKAIFFAVMFGKLNKYKGSNNYEYHGKNYLSSLDKENRYYIRYKDGVQYELNDIDDGDTIMSETWYYYKSANEKATYKVDMDYSKDTNAKDAFIFYYQEGFVYKNDSPYELMSEIAIDNYTIKNILDPFYMLKIDFENKDLILVNNNKNPEIENHVYIKEIIYIDLETGLLSKKEEYELDKLTSYRVYYDYEFDKNFTVELPEDMKKWIKEGYHLQEMNNVDNTVN